MFTLHSHRRALCRIELLILASTFALLIGVAAPVVQGQRRQISTYDCMYNLGEIARGAIQYGIDFDDWIVGSPNTSGAYLVYPTGAPPPTAYGPAVQAWDFMGVLQYLSGDPAAVLPAPGDQNAVNDRFNKLRGTRGIFRCPQNDFQAPAFPPPAPDAGLGPMVSYNTCRYQMWYGNLPNGRPGLTVSNSSDDATLPNARAPRISTLGNPANKVFCADGARYSTILRTPDYDLGVRSPYGGAFSDTAPYDTFSRSWDRSGAFGNVLGNSGREARQYAYRHSIGTPPPNAPGNAYQMNLAFYDGHVATQGDLDSSNPQQWLPAGTVLRTTSCQNDTRSYFNLPGQLTIGQ